MKKFAVFDIDGTLIRWQLYHTLVDRLARQNLLGADAHEVIHQARMRWKRRESEFGDYEKILISTYEAVLANIPTGAFDKLVTQVITEYKDQVYMYTRELITTLKQKDYFLIAISGSQDELVQQVAQYYGFNAHSGSKYLRESGRFTGEKVIASHHKKRILEELVAQYHLDFKDSIAVGDSKSDIPILEMVEEPIAFNPDHELFAASQKQEWKIVIERKNMIYRLEWRDGHYQLVETS